MASAPSRKLIRLTGAAVVPLLLAAGAWGWFNRTSLEAGYAAYQLRTATTDDDRARWADRLASDAGLPALLDLLRTGDPPTRAAVVAALDRHLSTLPDADPRTALVGGQVLDAFAACDDAGREAVLELLPTILKQAGAGLAAKCRDVTVVGLKLPGVASRLTAIRAAMHPAVRARAEVLPLLTAAEPEVRRAALFVVGPATDDEPVIGDEELFRWLHDPDEGVRRVCHDVLVSRGRSDPEIARGRRLTHPAAAERLTLLLDLRYDDDVSDPEPWLERLSRDPDPGVRAGSARVAVELAGARRLPVPVWVARLAESDADPTVRRVAGYYRSQPHPRADAEIRTAGGP